MDFIPNTKQEQEEMLSYIGTPSVNDLFKDIPSQILLKDELKISRPLSELELKNKLLVLAKKNNVNLTSFLGAGSYNHFIPSIVNHIISRSEFYTAYTPYQPEISQGTLQAIYEYQTMIADLTGTDVANASLYDGASALAEACIMSVNITKRKQIIMLRSIHPDYKTVVKTYCHAHDYELVEIEDNQISEKITSSTAALLVQNPNFFGCIEDIKQIEKVVHEHGALLVVNVVEPTSLGLLKPPGEFGADIVVGEGQSFGNPMNFGGPYLGIMATKDKFKRSIPGRLVGATIDTEEQRGFILTLQAREQHIRREKACSNICSNEGLCALSAAVHLTALGKQGIKKLAELNIQKAHYLADRLEELGFKLQFNKPFYNEFVIKVGDSQKISQKLLDNNILGGLELVDYYPELKDCILFCVTEVITKQDIEKLIELLR
ncbi:MAG: aminomethyl-transferring glycine dehydrogenase subunit GcvPA [Nanoarchaeota archaeon]